RRFTFSQRSLPQAITIKVNEIKNLKHERRNFVFATASFSPFAAFSHRLLEPLKTTATRLVNDYDFTVEYRRHGRKRFQGCGQIGELLRPILAIAAPETRLAATEMTNHAIAIKLQFVEPFSAGR